MQTLVDLNDKLIGLPSGLMVFSACIAVGYAIKMSKRLDNSSIPIVVMLFGMCAFMLIAPSGDLVIPERIWMSKNAMIGLIIGFAAWVSHKLVLKRIEEKLGIFTSEDKDDSLRSSKPDV